MKRREFSSSIMLGEQFSPVKFPHHPGDAVAVRSLESLPPHIIERMEDSFEEDPDGYVIKMYNPAKNVERHVFGTSTEGSDVQKVALLEQRKKDLGDYYDDVLPDLILDTHYFISRGTDDEVHIYEVQRRLDEFINPASNVRFPDSIEGKKFETYIKKLSADQKLTLADEIDDFIARTYQLATDSEHPVFSGHLPDFHERNIALTKGGHVRVYDFNILRDKFDVHARSAINFCLNTLKYIAEQCRAIE